MRYLPLWAVCGALLIAGCESQSTNPAGNQSGVTPHTANKPTVNDQMPTQAMPPATPGQPSTPGAPGPIEPGAGAVPPSGAGSPTSNPMSNDRKAPTQTGTSR